MRALFLAGVAMVLLGGSSVAGTPADPAKLPLSAWLTFRQDKIEGRAILNIGALPSPAMRNTNRGLEIDFPTDRPLDLKQASKIREVASVETRTELGHAIIMLALACNCAVNSTQAGKSVTIVISDAPPKTAADQPKNELAKLREELTAKLAQLNGAVPASNNSPTGQSAAPNVAGSSLAAVAPSAPRPSCGPDFNMSGWKGNGHFYETLTKLRQTAADTVEAPAELAALAEFYIGNGLANEAQDTARTALASVPPPSPADRVRLQRDADLASLLRGEAIDAQSPLLTDRPDCARTDIPLWRALSAAAVHDPIGVVRDAHAASRALGAVPDPLMQAFVFRLAYIAGDNVAALRDLAAAVRNANMGSPQDEAARFLMQAKLARAAGGADDEVSFLKRAAHFSRTIPGIVATERLAELNTAKDDAAGDHGEAVLSDMARVYRGQPIGQNASAALADRFLRHRDYVQALRVADESASPDGRRGADSRGATVVAKVLRTLLVNPPDDKLPEINERIALYLKYGGYATPGQAGDDIRLGAAKLLLGQNMASAALDALRLVSDGEAAKPEAKLLRASAEAAGGDPATALQLAQSLPSGPDVQRIGARALERMKHPLDAAHQLDGLPSIADRIHRADLFTAAQDWPDAATAYVELLRDPGVTGQVRQDVLARYTSVLALANPNADPASLEQADAASSVATWDPSKPADPGQLTLPAIREVLDRAKRVETMLPANHAKQGS